MLDLKITIPLTQSAEDRIFTACYTGNAQWSVCPIAGATVSYARPLKKLLITSLSISSS